MATVNIQTILLASPGGALTEFILLAGAQVDVLPKPVPWPFAPTAKADWTLVKAVDIPGKPQGWASADTIIGAPPVVDLIDKDQFAAHCWRSAFKYGANAHYLASMAQFRSGITNGKSGSEIGPFRLIPEEWNAYSADPLLNADILPDDIDRSDDGFTQIEVFATMARRTQDALTAKLARAPTVLEIYLAQCIGAAAAAAALQDQTKTFAQVLNGIDVGDLPPGGLARPDLLQRYKSVLLDAPAVAASHAAPVTGKPPPSVANNNPGNIISLPGMANWPGYGYVGADQYGFAKFATIGDGFRAINRNLTAYALDNLVTPREIVHKWAPNGQKGNNEAAYLKSFQQFGKFGPDDAVGSDAHSRARAAYAIQLQEGPSRYSQDQIEAFLNDAPAPAAAAGTVGAALARLSADLASAIDATRTLIETAGAPFVADGEGQEQDNASAALAAAPPADDVNFTQWFDQQLPGFTAFKAAEFLTKGASNAVNHLNTDPPKELWGHIIATAQVLAKLKTKLGGAAITLTSVYRSPAYNQSVGGVANSQHKSFAAADFVCSAPGGPQAWGNALREMRAAGVFSGGIGIYASFVHVDTRGSNADWA